MRIIGGEHGGRRFYPPANIPARPTTDIAKEGLFNTLQHMIDFENIKTLDIFGGTGSISYELASRGASDLTLIERARRLVGFIQQTVHSLRMDGCKIIQGDVFKFLSTQQEQYDFIFAGPPYALNEIDMIAELIFKQELLDKERLCILEHTPRNDYQKHPQFLRLKKYGIAIFTFLSCPH